MNTTQTPANSKIRREQIMGLYDDDFEGGAERYYPTENKTSVVKSMTGFQTPRFLKDTAGFAGKETLNLAKGAGEIGLGILKEGLNLFRENATSSPEATKQPAETPEAQEKEQFKIESNFIAQKGQERNQAGAAIMHELTRHEESRIAGGSISEDELSGRKRSTRSFHEVAMERRAKITIAKSQQAKNTAPEANKDLLTAFEGKGSLSALNAS